MIDFSTCTSAFASGETYSCNCIYGQLYLFFMSFFIFIKFFKILFLFIFINICWFLWLNVILRWISCVVHIRSSPVYIICIVLGRFSLFCVLSLTIIKAFIFKGRQQHHIITAPSDINTQSEGINEFSHLSIIIFLWITDVVVVQPSLLVWMCPVCFLWMSECEWTQQLLTQRVLCNYMQTVKCKLMFISINLLQSFEYSEGAAVEAQTVIRAVAVGSSWFTSQLLLPCEPLSGLRTWNRTEPDLL